MGWIAATLTSAACDENLRPGTTRANVCKATGFDGSGSVVTGLYIVGPFVLFAALVTLVPLARRHVVTTAGAVTVVAIGCYAAILSLAT
jgi:hypothetical protein